MQGKIDSLSPNLVVTMSKGLSALPDVFFELLHDLMSEVLVSEIEECGSLWLAAVLGLSKRFAYYGIILMFHVQILYQTLTDSTFLGGSSSLLSINISSAQDTVYK